SWHEFVAAGGNISGFRERRRNSVESMQRGDHLVCYVVGISRFIAVLEVTGKPFFDKSPIWKSDAFPARVPVKPIVRLTPETAIPIFELKDTLSFFQNLPFPNAWGAYFRGSPSRWSEAD